MVWKQPNKLSQKWKRNYRYGLKQPLKTKGIFKMKAKLENLIKNGAPRYLKIYDMPDTNDRYTIVFTGRGANGLYVGCNEIPTSPNCGVYMHGNLKQKPGAYLGKRIQWTDLPETVRNLVMYEYLIMWGIKTD